jgi:hypothetical protein
MRVESLKKKMYWGKQRKAVLHTHPVLLLCLCLWSLYTSCLLFANLITLYHNCILWNGMITVSDILKRTQKEVVSSFTEGSQEKHENLSQDNYCLDQDSIAGPSKYGTRVLNTTHCLTLLCTVSFLQDPTK